MRREIVNVNAISDVSSYSTSCREDWWRRVDSNHGPTDYETVALAT